MSTEVLNTIFAGATFTVIAATAIAALIQLRHLRASNQLTGLLTTLRMWYDPQVQQGFDFVRDDLAGRLKDPNFRADLEDDNVDRRVHVELYACDYWEQIGSYVKYGLLEEDSFLDVAGATINRFWKQLWPVISIMRKTRGDSLYENFEYIVVRSRLFISKHPDGLYPKGLPRVADLEAGERR